MRKALVVVAVCVSLIGGVAGTAFAHLHVITTPGGNQVEVPCEPFHGTTPGQSQHSANWDPMRGLHPIHWGLHQSPSGEHRAIAVTVSSQQCP